MNIEISIPTKIIILDDSQEYVFLLKILLEEKGYKNIHGYNCIVPLIKELDESSLIFIVDFHLSNSMDGAQACCMIKEKVEEAEIISISSLLSPDEYEKLINTCGCNAIARKSDIEKISFLLDRATKTINKKVKRAMEISLKGKAIIEQIEKF